ncbi:MAG: hypothetical protein GX660_13260 [Clostridiaceae bacterium]|nr:hypothetical protein [Clostridiaceae bacterium]
MTRRMKCNKIPDEGGSHYAKKNKTALGVWNLSIYHDKPPTKTTVK